MDKVEEKKTFAYLGGSAQPVRTVCDVSKYIGDIFRLCSGKRKRGERPIHIRLF